MCLQQCGFLIATRRYVRDEIMNVGSVMTEDRPFSPTGPSQGKRTLGIDTTDGRGPRMPLR